MKKCSGSVFSESLHILNFEEEMEACMGEWTKTGIPHKGWTCIDVVDLAEESEAGEEITYEQCEMCGNERIRFVHIMRHPDFSEELHVGCVCAEKMTDDYVNPRKCETELKNKAMRRHNFNKQEWWFNSAKHTYIKKYKGELLLCRADMAIGVCSLQIIEYGIIVEKKSELLTWLNK